MLSKWFDQWLGRDGAPPRAAAAEQKRLAGIDRDLLVGIADADESAQYAIQDCLDLISPRTRFAHLATSDALLMALQLQEIDLLVLSVDFGAADVAAVSGVPLLQAVVRVVPRVPILLLHGARLEEGDRPAYETFPQVRGLIAREDADFTGKLIRGAGQALAWHEKQRLKAQAIFETAEVEAEAGALAAAAQGYVAAYRTGDLSGAARQRLEMRLRASLDATAGDHDTHIDSLRVLIANSIDHHDELGLIYHTTLLREADPALTAEADTWLERSGEVVNQVYALIDSRLDKAMVQRRLGNYSAVLAECHAIQAKLANILPSYHLEAEALRQLGRLEEAVEVYHAVGDMCLRNGEVDRFFQAMHLIESLDLTGEHAERVAEKRKAVNRIEEDLADRRVIPRYPCLRVCTRSLCQEAAENSRGFFTVDAELNGRCDVCDIGRPYPLEELASKTIAVIGGRLPAEYTRALKDLGVGTALVHDGIEDVQLIPAMIKAADGVLLLTGYASHAGTIKAEHELARHPRPYTRIHFYGPKQVARGLLLDLMPRLDNAAPS